MNWANGDAFEGTSVFGHTVRTDTARRVGGDESGPKPTELFLFGIASCTGVDVVRIMRKARQPLDSLKITVKAEQNEDYPKPFHTVRIHFVAKGKGISEKRLKKAIAHADIEVLRRLEDEAGFHERTKSQDRFFGAGKSGGWRDVLSDAQVKRLVDRHRVQMNRFGYVPDGF